MQTNPTSTYKNIHFERISVKDCITTYKVTIFDGKGKEKTFESSSNAAWRLFSGNCNNPKYKFGGYTEKQAEKALMEEAIYAN